MSAPFRYKLYERIKPAVMPLLRHSVVNRLTVAIFRRLPAIAWRERIPAMGRNGLLALDNGQTVVLEGADRCSIARELFWHEGQLHDPADRLALDIAIRLSAQARNFLDIGSYTGLFALAVAKRYDHVCAHAYEIVPTNFISIWRNVIANDLVGRICPHLLGIAREPTRLTIAADYGPGILASSIALDRTGRDGIAIPVNSLDALFPDPVGGFVIKIDVEGFEWPVLDGARKLIAAQAPDIVCEFLRRAPHLPQVERLLAEHGYSTYRITGAGLVKTDRIVPVKYERDWLLTQKSPDALVALGLPLAPAVSTPA